MDHLELRDLVKFASVKTLRPYAVDVFIRKYGYPSVHISNNDVNKSSDAVIFISDNDLALSVLKQFGSEILDLKITFDDGTDAVKQILSHASEYCDNLTKFYLQTFTKDAMEAIKKPFKTVSSAGFSGKFNRLSNDVLSLGEIFPIVHKLDLEWFELNNGTGTFLPHLKNLRVLVKPDQYIDTTEESIKSLILENRHVQNINFFHTTTSMINFLSKAQLNLKMIGIVTLKSDYMDDIHFDGLTMFRMGRLTSGDLGMISFPQLQHFTGISQFFPIKQFLRNSNSTNLKTLELAVFPIFSDDLAVIMENTPNLIQAKFICSNEIQVDILIRFLEECEYLHKLVISVVHFSEHKIDELKVRISMTRHWNVAKLYTDLSITRKL